MGYLKQELPIELKGFGEAFESLGYQYSYNDLFYDFIDYTIACFLVDGDKEVAERLERKYKNNYQIFNKLLIEILQAMDMKLNTAKWFDPLGIVYETITSKWKSSKMGQFFTPESIVDLMTVMVNPEFGAKKAVLDCACGSGRMLLASHAHAPGNYQFGADLDPVCTKMTAINMLLHGCVGEAVCMDSIAFKWHFGYDINPLLNKFGTPFIRKIDCFENSNFYTQPTQFEKQEEKMNLGLQLQLF
jgi:type I restriction enzyme M protein